MSPKEVKRAGAQLRDTLEKKLSEEDSPADGKEAALLALDLLIGTALNIAIIAERK